MGQNQYNVICMKWGKKFHAGYVNRLYYMVENNLRLPHRFVCFTDEIDGINPKIETMPLPKLDDSGIAERCWKKLGVFQEVLFDLKGIALFLDLDVIIMQNLDDFFTIPGEFFIIRDWAFKEGNIGNSSVFRFEIGKHSEIIENFYKEGKTIRKRYQNEQAFLSKEMAKKNILRYWPFDWCISFKHNCLPRWPWCYFKTTKEPNTKILIFHGHPNPEEAYRGYIGKFGYRFVKPVRWLSKYGVGN